MQENKFKKTVRTQSPDYEEKKSLVLETAAKLFNEQGFENTSMLDLTKALGVTKPTLYWYFTNKEEILFTILDIAQERMARDLAVAVAHEGTARARLEIVMHALVRNSGSLFGKIIVKANPSHLSPQSASDMRERYKNSYRSIRKIILAGVEDGSLAPVDPKMAAFFLLGAVNWLAYWYKEGGDVRPDELATQFIGFLENGILPR